MKEHKMPTDKQSRAWIRLIRELEASLNDHDKFQQIMTDIEEILEPQASKKGNTDADKQNGEAQGT